MRRRRTNCIVFCIGTYLFNRDQLRFLSCMPRISSTINLSNGLDPLWKSLVGLFPRFSDPRIPVEVCLIQIESDWVSKKVVRSKDDETWENLDKIECRRQRSTMTNHSRHSNLAIAEYWCKKAHIDPQSIK